MTDSFNRLIRGVTKAEPELLDELGIILRLDIATRKFANANGLIAEKLTISQRRAAVFEEVQRQLIANFGAMESEADKLLNPFDRLMTKISDFAIAVQGPIVRVFGGMADFLSENFGALVTVVSMFAMSILKQIVPSFQQMGASAVAAGDLAKKRIRDLNKDIRTQKKAIKDVEREFKVSEVRKNKIFTAELKRRGISLKKFTAMSLKEQRKLVMQIMADEKKGLAHTQKFNKQRYASYKAVSERIKRESKRTSFTLIAHAKVAGAQITMALTKPLIKVQGAIAGIGVAAARLAPIFAFLGAIYWGAMLNLPPKSLIPKKINFFIIIWSVVPSIMGITVLLIKSNFSLLMLSLGFLLCQLVDEIFNKYLSFPNWYLPLRRILTLIVVIVLICSYFIIQTP